MTTAHDHALASTRRQFFGRAAGGIGTLALSSLLNAQGGLTHFAPKAKRIIYLFMQGGPSQLDLFDPKPGLAKRHGEELPESIRKGQRLTTMTSKQTSLPVAPSPFRFVQHGQSGAWVSELLPHTARIADELCIIRSMNSEAINHDPAITFLQTGHQQPGRPSFGSWLSYGLGTENSDLPAFVVLISRGSAVSPADPLYARLWGSGFLPSNHQGVSFRSSGDPVLYLSNPEGVRTSDRRRLLDTLGQLNAMQHEQSLDPEIQTRIAQYEMAFRMQSSVPELTDLRGESEDTFQRYGEDARRPGTFAANCLLARRLVEAGTRFVEVTTEYVPFFQWGAEWAAEGRLQGMSTEDAVKLVVIPTMRWLSESFGADQLVERRHRIGGTRYGRPKQPPGQAFTNCVLAAWDNNPSMDYAQKQRLAEDCCPNVTHRPCHRARRA